MTDPSLEHFPPLPVWNFGSIEIEEADVTIREQSQEAFHESFGVWTEGPHDCQGKIATEELIEWFELERPIPMEVSERRL